MEVRELEIFSEARGKLAVLDWTKINLDNKVCGLIIYYDSQTVHSSGQLQLLIVVCGDVQVSVYDQQNEFTNFSLAHNQYSLINGHNPIEIKSTKGSIFVLIDFSQEEKYVLPKPFPKDVKLFDSECVNGSIDIYSGLHKIDFNIRRIFYIYDVPFHQSRGEHRHLYCSEILSPLRGNFKAEIQMNEALNEIELTSPCRALLIPPLVWAKQYEFSKDAICLVVADHSYDVTGYIKSIVGCIK